MSYLGIRGVECHSSSKVMLDIGCNWGPGRCGIVNFFQKNGRAPMNVCAAFKTRTGGHLECSRMTHSYFDFVCERPAAPPSKPCHPMRRLSGVVGGIDVSSEPRN